MLKFSACYAKKSSSLKFKAKSRLVGITFVLPNFGIDIVYGCIVFVYKPMDAALGEILGFYVLVLSF